MVVVEHANQAGMNVVEADGVVVVYKGGIRALDGVDVAVERGELFSLVGPNGAGKTTLMKVFTTLLKPTSGTVRISGYDVASEPLRVRKVIGYVPQGLSADDELTGMENMMLQCRLYGINRSEAHQRSLRLLDLVGLREDSRRLVGSYSGGMRRRLEIALALVHTPEVLFLDEPTVGLDVQSRLMIWEYLKVLRKEEGMTIVFTTHNMEESDKLSDKVGIIDNGKVVALGTPSELKGRIGGDVVVLRVNGVGIREALSGLSSVIRVEEFDGEYRVKVRSAETDAPEILRQLAQRGLRVERAELIKPSLEQAFIELTGRSYREGRLDQSLKVLMRKKYYG